MNEQRSWTETYKSIAAIILNTLLLILLIEGLSALILKGIERDEESLTIEDIQDWYEVDSDAADAILELKKIRDVRFDYYPYTLWRRAPYESETINVDDEGLRVTPGSECVTESYVVHVYGGSTVWGSGTSDSQTIPALLYQRLADEIEGPVCVVNYGQPAYVSTQDVIQLYLNLQAGQIPDLVIEYQGINDTVSALQSGAPYAHHNLANIEQLFEKPNTQVTTPNLLMTSRTFRLVQTVLSDDTSDIPRAGQSQVTDIEGLPERIIDTYRSNYKVIDALSKAYGFDYLVFWQPVVFVDKELTPRERRITRGTERNFPGVTDLFIDTYQMFEDMPEEYENLYSLADAFSDVEDLYYIDAWHVLPEGNQTLVEQMMGVIETKIEE